jgi:hypothetical protein
MVSGASRAVTRGTPEPTASDSPARNQAERNLLGYFEKLHGPE